MDAAARHMDGIAACQQAVSHIQLYRKILRFDVAKVDLFAVQRHADGGEIDGVDDLAEIPGIAVLPPAHAGLVRKPDAGDVGTLMVLACIALLKITAHTHVAVADGGKALHEQHIFPIQ